MKKYYFDIAIQAHIYGEVEADSEQEAKEKIELNLKLHPQIDDCDCDFEWETKEPCRGNVCNFYGGGIEITVSDEDSE